MYSTIQELHVEIEQKINQITGNLNHSFAPEYIDMMLNRTALKYIDAICSDKSNALREGFEETNKRYDEIENLIEEKQLTTYLTPVSDAKTTGAYSWALLPNDYYRYVSSHSLLHFDKTKTVQREWQCTNYTVIDFNRLTEDNITCLDNIEIIPAGAINPVSFPDINKYNGIFDKVNYIYDTLKRLGYDVRLNTRDNHYSSPCIYFEDIVQVNFNNGYNPETNPVISVNQYCDWVYVPYSNTITINNVRCLEIHFGDIIDFPTGFVPLGILRFENGNVISNFAMFFIIYLSGWGGNHLDITTNPLSRNSFIANVMGYFAAKGISYIHGTDLHGNPTDDLTFILLDVSKSELPIEIDSQYLNITYNDFYVTDTIVNPNPNPNINTKKVQNDLIKTSEIWNTINSVYGNKNRHLNPIGELINNRIRIYNGNNFEILGITLRYIRKPLAFSIINNTLSDIKITNRFIDTVVSDILLQLKDNSYQLVNNNKETE